MTLSRPSVGTAGRLRTAVRRFFVPAGARSPAPTSPESAWPGKVIELVSQILEDWPTTLRAALLMGVPFLGVSAVFLALSTVLLAAGSGFGGAEPTRVTHQDADRTFWTYALWIWSAGTGIIAVAETLRRVARRILRKKDALIRAGQDVSHSGRDGDLNLRNTGSA